MQHNTENDILPFGDDIVVCVWILLGMFAVIIAAAYLCFRLTFYVSPRQKRQAKDLPQGEIYEPFRQQIENWAKQTDETPHEEFSIVSFDGLQLFGKYYEYQKGAPIELMFHGYRGTARRDLSGGVQRCFQLGRNALIVDQRCSNKSEGNVITFGIREHKDCLQWVDFLVNHFGNDVKIILTGISMGAATVLMAAGKPLPQNVIGVLADCGYTGAKDIIQKVIKQIGLPPTLFYFFVKLGARIFGGFDLEEDSPQQLLKNCKIPVIFFHGDADDFVPCEMSKLNYDTCSCKKKLVIVKGAGHGLCFPVDPETYLDELKEFFKEENAPIG